MRLGSIIGATIFAVSAVSFCGGLPPVHAGVLTVEIFGTGTGTFNSNAFGTKTPDSFSFLLVGPDGGHGIPLATADVNLGGFATATIPNALINVNPVPQYAFLQPNTNGGVSFSGDYAHIFFSPSDFFTLQHSNSFFANPGTTTISFLNEIPTSGGPLIFRNATVTGFTTFDTGSPGAVPEVSTWMMMLIGFAGIGLTAYRRAKKPAALSTG